jgi:hypothetical protein
MLVGSEGEEPRARCWGCGAAGPIRKDALGAGMAQLFFASIWVLGECDF